MANTVVQYRPTGNLIASTQLKPHRQDVVFFERNGLQHGEFTLCAGEGGWIVREVKWNNDSSVLAIFLEGEEKTVEVATPEKNPLTKGVYVSSMFKEHCHACLRRCNNTI